MAAKDVKFGGDARQKMLEGIRPKECDYCWIAEDADTNSTTHSDRITKSSEDWATPYLKEVTNKSWTENSNPSYVEVSFSNVCNFKCSYCSPEISSKWLEEINEYGGYAGTSYNFNNLEGLKQIKMLIIALIHIKFQP